MKDDIVWHEYFDRIHTGFRDGRIVAKIIPNPDGTPVSHIFDQEKYEGEGWSIKAQCSCGYTSTYRCHPLDLYEVWSNHAHRLEGNYKRRISSSPRKRDSQRSKVYSMENEALWTCHTGRMTFDQCLVLITEMSNHPVISPHLVGVNITLRRTTKKATHSWIRYSTTNKPEISLSHHGLRPDVVVHEMSHLVADHIFQRKCQHDSSFVAVLLALTEKWCPTDYTRALFKAAGKVKVNHSALDSLRQQFKENQ